MDALALFSWEAPHQELEIERAFCFSKEKSARHRGVGAYEDVQGPASWVVGWRTLLPAAICSSVDALASVAQVPLFQQVKGVDVF